MPCHLDVPSPLYGHAPVGRSSEREHALIARRSDLSELAVTIGIAIK